METIQLESASCPAAFYLRVSQNEDDVLELVDVSRCDSRRDDLGVDSDFPRCCVARVVRDTGVGARLQDVTDAVVSHKHHGHASWWAKQSCWVVFFRRGSKTRRLVDLIKSKKERGCQRKSKFCKNPLAKVTLTAQDLDLVASESYQCCSNLRSCNKRGQPGVGLAIRCDRGPKRPKLGRASRNLKRRVKTIPGRVTFQNCLSDKTDSLLLPLTCLASCEDTAPSLWPRLVYHFSPWQASVWEWGGWGLRPWRPTAWLWCYAHWRCTALILQMEKINGEVTSLVKDSIVHEVIHSGEVVTFWSDRLSVCNVCTVYLVYSYWCEWMNWVRVVMWCALCCDINLSRFAWWRWNCKIESVPTPGRVAAASRWRLTGLEINVLGLIREEREADERWQQVVLPMSLALTCSSVGLLEFLASVRALCSTVWSSLVMVRPRRSSFILLHATSSSFSTKLLTASTSFCPGNRAAEQITSVPALETFQTYFCYLV